MTPLPAITLHQPWATLIVEYPDPAPTFEECPRLYQWAPEGDEIDDIPHWPAVKVWFSRGPAARRLRLLETYGCRGVVVESEPVTWPDPKDTDL